MQEMYVIVGLGNPGSQYLQSRHNAGFMAAEIIAQKHGIKLNKARHKAIMGEGKIAGKRVILAQPQTFMNASGQSVNEILHYYKLTNANLIVIYDDIDLPLGKIRVRPEGSAGTHNGMRSVVEFLGSEQFARVRVGVGRPEVGRELADFVLDKFMPAERDIIFEALARAADAAVMIMTDGAEAAMAKYNG